MATSADSSAWYRVARVKPRLQDHISIHRHNYREQTWFILQDQHKGKSHRFNSAAYFLITCMNGQRDMQEIWDIANTKFLDNTPSQDEIMSLLGKLYQSDLIQTDVIPDIDELSHRGHQSQQARFKQYFLNPLSIRIPLVNPDNFLNRTSRYVRFLFHKRVLYSWISLVIFAGLLTIMNWPELTNATRLHAFTTQNLLLLFIAYPIIKLLHELGHAYAIKHRGGEVNEMGIMLLIFIPIPYVNAHSAVALPDKNHRMIVSAAGIMIESSLAAIALLFWLNIEPGLLRTLCLDIILIGGLSTILVNGNPLLRFDGYYILADAIDIPNLTSRARKYLAYLSHHYLFGIEKSDTGVNNDSEKGWLAGYGLAAFIYKIFLMLFILGLVLEKFFAAGILLAVWIVSIQFVLPIFRYFKQLNATGQTSQQKGRVYSVMATATVVSLLMLFFIPLPQTSTTQGIIWLSEEMQIRTRSPGFVKQLFNSPNQMVKQDDPIMVISDPLLASQVKVLEAKLKELKVKHTAKRHEHLEAQELKQKIATTSAELEDNRQRLASLTLHSPANGKLVIPDFTDLPGQYLQQGQIIGFILEPEHIVTQIIIREQEIALFEQNSSSFEVRPVAYPDKIIPATFKRVIPEAVTHLPSAALGIQGGGPILVDPDDPAGTKTIEKVFQVELDLPAGESGQYIGSRVYVRIKHGKQPLFQQWSRSLKQLFLGRFNV